MRRNKVTYSITSSATPNSAGGIVMPSVFAVLRLIDSIILVGNFAGRRAVENFVCEIGAAAIAPVQIDAIAYQTAVQYVQAMAVNRLLSTLLSAISSVSVPGKAASAPVALSRSTQPRETAASRTTAA